MEDIRSVLSQFQSKKKDPEETSKSQAGPSETPSLSEIPDVFFDVILRKHKLTRQEISLLMFLYRQVWTRPNLYRSFGIGPLNSYAELAILLGVTQDELVHGLRNLEQNGLIMTVRAGQYFVRRFFSEELDARFGQNYEDFF